MSWSFELDLGDDLGVVGALSSNQKTAGVLLARKAIDGQLDPILDGGVQHMQGSPASTVPTGPCPDFASVTRTVLDAGTTKVLLCEPVFFGGLHQADVGHAAHRDH